MGTTDFIDPPILYVLEDGWFPQNPAGNDPIPFTVRLVSSIPAQIAAPSAVLLPFPKGKPLCRLVPRTAPFIAYGDCPWIEDAFSMGAAEFLRTPLDPVEFRVRVEKVLAIGRVVRLSGSDIYLRQSELVGPHGSVFLNKEEARFMRILAESGPRHVSRTAVRKAVWPKLPDSSRVVDTAVSRMRKHLRSVCGAEAQVQISSVRGFGYILTAQ